MLAILLALLIILLLGGLGFSMHLLWIIAAVILVLFLVGFAAHGAGGRWFWW